MGNVINLRRVRKQKTREAVREKVARATQVSGVKKTERDRVIRLKTKADRQLDGHKIEDGE
jgi:hypothetical protein